MLLCRGSEVLNVALRGTLHQHLPDLTDEVDDRQTVDGRRTTHEARLVADSRLASVIGPTRPAVNSFRHQAPAALGPGLCGRDRPDGAVEAIESTGTGVVFGVQWHAECLVERSEHLALLEGLVRVGAQHAASGLRGA